MKNKITFSDTAILKIKEQLSQRNTPNANLRIGIKGGSCEGYIYFFQYEDELPKEKDIVFNFDGIQVLIDKKSMIYLDGTFIDWHNTVMERGFIFNNPNVKSQCGCGKSISFKE